MKMLISELILTLDELNEGLVVSKIEFFPASQPTSCLRCSRKCHSSFFIGIISKLFVRRL